jgi:hypothetical protein
MGAFWRLLRFLYRILVFTRHRFAAERRSEVVVHRLEQGQKSRAEHGAEKAGVQTEPEKHPSGAKAHVHLLALCGG